MGKSPVKGMYVLVWKCPEATSYHLLRKPREKYSWLFFLLQTEFLATKWTKWPSCHKSSQSSDRLAFEIAADLLGGSKHLVTLSMPVWKWAAIQSIAWKFARKIAIYSRLYIWLHMYDVELYSDTIYSTSYFQTSNVATMFWASDLTSPIQCLPRHNCGDRANCWNK